MSKTCKEEEWEEEVCVCVYVHVWGGIDGILPKGEKGGMEKARLFLIATGAAAQAQRCIITYLTERHNHRPSLINTPYLKPEYK